MIQTSREAREQATNLLLFLDGAEDAGGADAGPEVRRRARIVARGLLGLADQLDAERSARIALQARCNRLQSIVGGAAYAALTERMREDAE